MNIFTLYIGNKDAYPTQVLGTYTTLKKVISQINDYVSKLMDEEAFEEHYGPLYITETRLNDAAIYSTQDAIDRQITYVINAIGPNNLNVSPVVISDGESETDVNQLDK